MKILVTGGAGYIGSHTSQKLLDAGHQVVVCDNLTTGFAEAVPSAAVLVRLDVNDTDKLTQLMAEQKFDGVIHFAAKLSVLESVTKPMTYFQNNTVGVLSLIKACAAKNVKRIVFSSTAATYGNVLDGKPLTEDMITQLNSCPKIQLDALEDDVELDFVDVSKTDFWLNQGWWHK